MMFDPEIHAKPFSKALSTLMRFQKYAFTLLLKTHQSTIDSRPHCRFGAFSTVHTKTFENDIIARCDVT